MVTGIDTFVLSVALGVIIGGINAFFRYHEQDQRAAIRTFTGWFLAFAVTGIIASPVAQWLLVHVF